ncbi:hypothetical protein ACVR0S_07075 [Streptococcus dentapri]|uniref:DUF3021 domain-containing protein n=1 Tax=Streptococcus dentapri TaxID=573564 RepID=A0ABV8CZT3_9STRE
MKKIMTNIFATTGISVILLALIAIFFKAQWLLLLTIFQVLMVNILIHVSLLTRQKWELDSFLAAVLDLVIIEAILFLAGSLFNWNTGVWILLLMGLIVYALSRGLDLFYLNKEAREINLLIKKRQRY